jgi:hypothetical protein
MQKGWMTLNESFEALTSIHEEMKAVRNLPGLGSCSIGRLGILARPVTTNHAEVRMGTKPGLCRRTASILKHIHYLVGLEIDDHRSIALAFTKGKIIQPNLRRFGKSRRLLPA